MTNIYKSSPAFSFPSKERVTVTDEIAKINVSPGP